MTGYGRRSLRPLLPFALAYACGPLAPLVVGKSRRNWFWSILAILTVASAGAAVLGGSWLWAAFLRGTIPVAGAVAVLTTWSIATTLCWTWGVWRTGRNLDHETTLPDWVRFPGAVGGAGCFAPGAGLMLAGHPRRGAAVVIGVGPVLTAALLVFLGPSLWRANLARGVEGMSGLTLEWILVVSAGVLVLGTFLWIVQVLDGMRLASRRIRPRPPRSTVLVWALLVVLLIAPWFLHPSRLAGPMVDSAGTLEKEGMQLAPLVLVKGAMWLEPREPGYALHASWLYDALGQERQARAIREDLRRRWTTIAHATPLPDPSPGQVEPAAEGAERPDLPAPVPPTTPLVESPSR